MESMQKIFVSSTWIDLQSERQAIADTLHKMDAFTFVGMEYFGSRDLPPKEASEDAVDTCDLYVCIVGDRYGSGITGKEYDRARRLNLPCFIYFLKSDASMAEHDPDLIAFSARLNEAHVCSNVSSSGELALAIATDLHNWLLSHGIDRGLTALAGDYRMRVQNFVAEYVGNRERIVPFGGRNAELDQLQQWLNEGPSSPFMLITAPAGRGKSALLVEWARQLQSQAGLAVLLFPISIRFRTNLSGVVFCSIATYLANLHGDRLSIAADSPPEIWRGLMLDYLSRPLLDGRQLVLIVDGLDEAADWRAGPDLFPAQIGETSKVLVSARQLAGDSGSENWLQRLGWDAVAGAKVMELSRLAESAVSDILLRTGVPLDEIAGNPTLVSELHRLSEGDPLLVRLYVTELWSRGEAVRQLTIGDLREIEPGFEGFLNRWWEDQKSLWRDEHPLREKSVQALASALACALGPLTRDDLFELLGEDGELSTWTFDDALVPLKRFIVGDGEEQGYVFSHPRLGVYFNERLSVAERNRFARKFLAWGEATVIAIAADETLPQDVSQYLVEYLAAHLVSSHASEDQFAMLVTDGWRQARYLHEGTYAGFASDLDIVVDRIKESHSSIDGTPAISALLIKCLTCISSIDQISKSTPPEFVIAAIRSQLWPVAAAAVYAGMIENPLHRAKVFVYLADVSNGDTRIRMLDEAWAALVRIKNEESNLTQVPSFEESSHLETEYLKTFEEFVSSLPKESLPSSLPLMAPLSQAGKRSAMLYVIERAPDDLLYAMLDACTNIVDEFGQTECLKSLGNRYSSQLFDVAINQHHERITSRQFTCMSIGAADALDNDRGRKMLEMAAAVAREITDIEVQTELLIEVCTHPKNSDMELFNETLQISLNLTNPNRRARLLIRLAESTQSSRSVDLADQALSSMKAIKSEFFLAVALAEFAPLASNENAEQIIRLLERISDEQKLTETVAKLVAYLPADAQSSAFAFIEHIDRFTLLTGFASAPQQIPVEWIWSIQDLCEDDQLTPYWVFKLVRCYGPILDEKERISLLGQISESSWQSSFEFTSIAAFAAILPFVNDKILKSLPENILPAFSTPRQSWSGIPNEVMQFLEEIFRHASAELLVHVSALVEQGSNSQYDRIASLLAPYLNRDQVQNWIRSFQTISDLAPRRSFYVECLNRLGGGNARSEYVELWRLLDPADRLYLLLQDTRAQNSQTSPDVNEMLELTRQVKDDDRRVFLFLELLTLLDPDSESAHWPEFLTTVLLIAESTQSHYAKEVFQFILDRLPERLMQDNFDQIFNLAVKFRSQNLHRLASSVPSQIVENAFHQARNEDQLYILLNSGLSIEFDMNAFVDQLDEHDAPIADALIIALLKLVDSEDYKVPWSKIIKVAIANQNHPNQEILETIIWDAPKQHVVNEFNGLFGLLSNFQPNPEVAGSLLQKVPSHDIIEAIIEQWSTGLLDDSSTRLAKHYSISKKLKALIEWALLATDDPDLVLTRLAKILAQVDEHQRFHFISDWIEYPDLGPSLSNGSRNPDFGPYLLEHSCEFEDPMYKPVLLARLIAHASSAQVPEVLDQIVELIDKDLSYARRIFAGKLDSNLDWLIRNQEVKIAVLIEMVATTSGPAQQHIAMYALRVLRSIADVQVRMVAAEELWKHLPGPLRSLLEASTRKLELLASESGQVMQSSAVTGLNYSVDIISSIKDGAELLPEVEVGFILEAFKTHEMQEGWAQNLAELQASRGTAFLADEMTDALSEHPDAYEMGRKIWQQLLLTSTHSGRVSLVETLTALVPVTNKLFGDDALRDQMLGVHECSSWWE